MRRRLSNIVYRVPKLSKRGYGSLMQTLETILGFDTSDRAKFRFHVLSVFYESGWKATKLAFPKLSRATLYRWKRQYETSGKRLNSLVPKSTRPQHTRVMQTPLVVLQLIKSLREQYPRLGKNKIKPFVDALCRAEGISSLKQSTIGKVIKRNNLFFAGKSRGRRVRGHELKRQRQRIKLCPKVKGLPPGYIQLDGFRFYYIDKYCYFLTAIDIVSKQAWVVLVPRINSHYAREFLKQILTNSYHPVHSIQTDNGSEFKLHFEEAAKKANLRQLFSYPKHPKTNGYVERFNWTVQDEFLFNSEDLLLYPEEFAKELDRWLVWYNKTRPHQSLGYLSPYQHYQKGEACLKCM